MLKKHNFNFLILLSLLLIASINIVALDESQQGTTINIPEDNLFLNGVVVPSRSPREPLYHSDPRIERPTGWEEINSIDINKYLSAGQYWGVEFNNINNQLNISTNCGDLSELAELAIEKSPNWIKPQLEWVFTQIPHSKQDYWAQEITNASDPYIDEIAFAISRMSPTYLSQMYQAEVFTLNAHLMYQYDNLLDYVEIVDIGNSVTDADFYSTTKYKVIDEWGHERSITAPREVYYWNIVMPKITDEIPGFINPNTVESNSSHNNNLTDSSTGKFWRDYLFNYADPGYPLLKDYLLTAQYAYNPTNPANSAINQMTSWIEQSMVFTSGSERPHQPVRIYKKHIGRCGEHADLRAAVGRIALIPLRSIFTISGDHTWNEFWQEDWIHWDGNDIDNPNLYESGWGRTYGSVFEIRSDGYLTPVTSTYSQGTADLIINVVDANHLPVDGARVTLACLYDGSLRVDNWGFTDQNGQVIFEVGDSRGFHIRVSSYLGNYPAEGYATVTNNTVDGAVYDVEAQLSGSLPVFQPTTIDFPTVNNETYKLITNYVVHNEVLSGVVPMDDLSGALFTTEADQGNLDYFLCDVFNLYSATSSSEFSAYMANENSTNGSSEMNMPENSESYYSILSNTRNNNNLVHVSADFTLYRKDTIAEVGTLSGQITANSENLSCANLTIIVGNTVTATSDAEGNFTCQLAPGEYDAIVYRNNTPLSVKHDLEIEVNETTICNIILDTNYAFQPVTNLFAELNVVDEVILSWNQPVNIERAIVAYRVQRVLAEELNNPESYTDLGTTSELFFTDGDYLTLPNGRFVYAVMVEYENSMLSPQTFSNIISKGLHTLVNVQLESELDLPIEAGTFKLKPTNNIVSHGKIINITEANFSIEDVFITEYELSIDVLGHELYTDTIDLSANSNLVITLTGLAVKPQNVAVINGTLSWDSPAILGVNTNSLDSYKVYLDEELVSTQTETTYTGIDYAVHTVKVSALYNSHESEAVSLNSFNGNSLGKNKVAEWSFENNLNDNMATHTGIDHGTVSYSPEGVAGSAVSFDGINDFVSVAEHEAITATGDKYSLKFWFKSDGPAQSWTGLIGRPGRNSCVWTHPDKFIHHRFHTSKGGFNDGVDTPHNEVAWNMWNQVVITNNGDVAKTYINGILKAELLLLDREMIIDSSPLIIGKSPQDLSDGGYFKGLMDEITLWNVQLTGEQIAGMFENEKPASIVVSGNVFSNNNAPVNAKLKFNNLETTSNNSGTYTIDLFPGGYDVLVSKDGYATLQDTLWIDLTGSYQNTNYTISELLSAPTCFDYSAGVFTWRRVNQDRVFVNYLLTIAGETHTLSDTTFVQTVVNADCTLKAVYSSGSSSEVELNITQGSTYGSGLLHHYSFNTNCDDQVGDADGTAVGVVEYTIVEPFATSSLILNGEANYVELGTAEEMGIYDSDFTIVSLFQVVNPNRSQNTLLGTSFAGNNKGLHLELQNRKIQFGMYGNDSSVSVNLQNNIWYLIAFQYVKETGCQRIMLNGELLAESYGHDSFQGAEQTVYIGRAAENRFFDGTIKSVNFYNRAISLARFAETFAEISLDFSYGSVAGTVIDGTNTNPMPNALVTINGHSAITDNEGSFSIISEAGTYDLSVSVPYWTAITVAGVEIQAGEITQVGNVGFPFVENDNGVEELVATKLLGNYPNPFNPETTISFNLNKNYREVKIFIYNLKGQLVDKLVQNNLEKGKHDVVWNGKNLDNKRVASGLYYYRLETPDYSETKKMVLMK